uniref:Protein bicaudal D homolog 2-like n=1 Tax=Phallusia mammillata TaxID=59560 RepID=A0A6F9D8C3_9ASCI|nr:protein bicaudal D homolog 2-like [Phallusia mammillata]
MESNEDTISRLTGELEDAHREKVQAAEYGLQVLEENRVLQQRQEELEHQLELTQRELDLAKHEFDLSTKALYSTQNKTRKAFSEGELRENDLEKQRKDAEDRLAALEKEREYELSQSRTAVTNAQAEIERLNALNNELTLMTKHSENQRLNLRKEVKELMSREASLMNDYSELEEENCSLQKQVSVLRQSQAEYEGFKHEIRRLEEEAEFLNSQLEEALKLKDILEHQLDEAHETIAKERELKLSMKRELSQFINFDVSSASFNENLGSLINNQTAKLEDLEGNKTKGLDDDDDPLDHPLIRHITSDVLHSTPSKKPTHSNSDDLLSELNLTEVTKLKQQLTQAEKEKMVLLNSLREQQRLLENAKGELNQQNEKEEGRFTDVLSEAERLREELKNLRDENSEKRETNKKLEQTYKEVKSKEQTLVRRNQTLELEIDTLNKEIANRVKQARLSADELSHVSDHLSQLYHHTCLAAGDTPQCVVLESIRNKTHSTGKTVSEDSNNSANIDDKIFNGDEPDMPASVLDTMNNQIKYLKSAIEKLVASKDQPDQAIALSGSQANLVESQEQVRILEEEVLRLRSLLSSKREQIATLRTVLKANKHTAEVAIQNLKSKYQHEKMFVSETMLKLRGELKALKEDAVTFAQLRMMFAARCDEYVAQLDAMQRHLASAEDEKRTLNTLLRKTITQKLAITQRLEDLEFAQEQQSRTKNSYASVVTQGTGAKKKSVSPGRIFR